MEQNYLGGDKGIQINAYMAETDWNLKKMMEKIKKRSFVFSMDDVLRKKITFIFLFIKMNY